MPQAQLADAPRAVDRDGLIRRLLLRLPAQPALPRRHALGIGEIANAIADIALEQEGKGQEAGKPEIFHLD